MKWPYYALALACFVALVGTGAALELLNAGNWTRTAVMCGVIVVAIPTQIYCWRKVQSPRP